MEAWRDWYDGLAKPSWTPEAGTIGMIWGVLYPIIAITHGFVFVQVLRGRLPARVALPFAVNIVANLAFTPLQFGLQNLTLAWIDILIVLASIVWCMAAVWRHHRWVAIAQLPYLAWVATATTLQTYITFSN
jgi:translocator protein